MFNINLFYEQYCTNMCMFMGIELLYTLLRNIVTVLPHLFKKFYNDLVYLLD